MIIGDFDRTYSSSLRIYSNYHRRRGRRGRRRRRRRLRRRHHHHHHQSLHVLEIVPYLHGHGLPGSHVDL